MTSHSTSRRTLLTSSLAGAAVAALAAPSKITAQTPEPVQEATPVTGTQPQIVPERTETVFQVLPAVSQRNLFAGATIPQHPHMGDNGWNSAHQDAFCSESVGVSGPTGSTLKLIKQPHPFGFIGVMACNRANQMMGTAFNTFKPIPERTFEFVVFDQNLSLVAQRTIGGQRLGSFGGGYFFLNSDDNAVVNDSDRDALICLPTADVPTGDPLEPLWRSANLVELVTGSPTGNSLYAALPAWDDPTLYWVLFSGGWSREGHLVTLTQPAYLAMVRITPDPDAQDGATTELVHAMELPDQWNNNTFAVDETGCYIVTNGVTAEGVSNAGALYAMAFNPASGQIEPRWTYEYQNSGMLKPGHGNIGSGTTPTIMVDESGRKLIAITDNANPRIQLVVVDAETGELVTETPVFPSMRGACEASLIAVNNRIVVPNNFGHTMTPLPQTVTNEPGLTMIEVAGESGAEIVWEDTRTVTVGMNMLCRESGIIFAHTADWNDDVSATEGAMYYLSAIDAWDGRVIWRIPIGRGRTNVKDLGGQYFDRDGNVYLGTGLYMVSIQNVEA